MCRAVSHSRSQLFDELNENVTSLLGAQGDEISELRVEMRDRIKFLAARLTDIMGEIGKKSEQSQTSVKDVVNEAAKCLSDGLNDVLIKVGKMTSPHVVRPASREDSHACALSPTRVPSVWQVVGSPVKTRAKAKAPVLTEKEPFEASSEILKVRRIYPPHPAPSSAPAPLSQPARSPFDLLCVPPRIPCRAEIRRSR